MWGFEKAIDREVPKDSTIKSESNEENLEQAKEHERVDANEKFDKIYQKIFDKEDAENARFSYIDDKWVSVLVSNNVSDGEGLKIERKKSPDIDTVYQLVRKGGYHFDLTTKDNINHTETVAHLGAEDIQVPLSNFENRIKEAENYEKTTKDAAVKAANDYASLQEKSQSDDKLEKDLLSV